MEFISPVIYEPKDIIKELVAFESEIQTCKKESKRFEELQNKISENEQKLLDILLAFPARINEFNNYRKAYDADNVLQPIFDEFNEMLSYLKEQSPFLFSDNDETNESIDSDKIEMSDGATSRLENQELDGQNLTVASPTDAANHESHAIDSGIQGETVDSPITYKHQKAKVIGPNNCVVNLSLPDEMHTVLWRFARISKVSLSELIRNALLSMEKRNVDFNQVSEPIKGKRIKLFITEELYNKIDRQAFLSLKSRSCIVQEMLSAYARTSEFKIMSKQVKSYLEKI